MRWIWQRPDWPRFLWDEGPVRRALSEVAEARGALRAELTAVGVEVRQELELAAFTEDGVGTSAIEGHDLPPQSVRSSVAHRLGLAEAPASGVAEGVVTVLVDATRQASDPLAAERLFGWHAALFPTGWSGMARIRVGAWREVPIAVRSGVVGTDRVHFEAPPPDAVPGEMVRLLGWWADEGHREEPVLAAALLHLWFETVHPFEDGNGRIGRALADLALARDGVRAFSLSRQILEERSAYYQALEHAQGGDLDVTPWVLWFCGCVGRAVGHARAQVGLALSRDALLRAAQGANPRQLKALLRLVEAGPDGFEGGLTNRKYRSLTRAAAATASRDLADLEARGLLLRQGSGRAVQYQLAWERFRR